MVRRGHLRRVLTHPGFLRLYLTRLSGQFGDGVFQASLAGFVLFNPERQAHAADIAAAFAVLLVPYSLIGPFAGVLLDRWWRQRVLGVANALRASGVLGLAVLLAQGLHGQPFYACALVVISVNRFILSALSAALPHVVGTAELVTANALSTTSGAVATTVGGACAIVVRVLVGGTTHDYAAIAAAAAVPYLLASAAARGFARRALGPDDVERSHRETIRSVAAGLVAGARHTYARRPVFVALLAIGAHRLCYGATTVSFLLLYRNYFNDDGFFRSGLAGLGQVVTAIAIGAGLAAVVTPRGWRQFGLVRWPTLMLFGAAGVQIGLGLPYRLPLLLVAALLLGFAAQAIKICVDTVVQQRVDDDFRGRVFALYDTLFNLTLVLAAVVAAFVLPDSGHAPASVIAIGAGYALTGVGYLYYGSRAATRASG